MIFHKQRKKVCACENIIVACYILPVICTCEGENILLVYIAVGFSLLDSIKFPFPHKALLIDYIRMWYTMYVDSKFLLFLHKNMYDFLHEYICVLYNVNNPLLQPTSYICKLKILRYNKLRPKGIKMSYNVCTCMYVCMHVIV